jgi:predicted DNA-binding protein
MREDKQSGLVNLSIRLEPELKRRVEEVAALGSVKPADVIRICVVNGLGIVEQHYQALRKSFGNERLRAVAQRKLKQGARCNSASAEHGLPPKNEAKAAGEG